jgi:hypothetical protein
MNLHGCAFVDGVEYVVATMRRCCWCVIRGLVGAGLHGRAADESVWGETDCARLHGPGGAGLHGRAAESVCGETACTLARRCWAVDAV